MNTASCQCGQFKLAFAMAIEKTALCHCNSCRKRTGNTSGLQARLHEDDITIDGEFRVYRRVADSGKVVEHFFCPVCGTTVFMKPEAMPGSVSLAAGTLDADSIPAPTFSVYEERLQPWFALPSTIEDHWD